MIFSTQYYRPPFPNRPRWKDDLALIAATGFDTIYATVPWSWVEPAPGDFRFDDFDELVERAGALGLQVIFNLFAETQPLWVHRELPDASLVDHMGNDVVSSALAYMHFGLMPGGCTDHPELRRRMGAFLCSFAARYAGSPHIRSWDCWNEMRATSQSDGYVCYCTHTKTRWRDWLAKQFGDLDGLNRAWQRRYTDWRDVQPPKLQARTYTDVMAWQRFLTERTAEDLRWRYESVRAGDATRPIVAHAAFPSIHNTGEFFEHETALARGNDWQLARQVDEYGCSHFPAWFHGTPVDFAGRIEAVRCATGDKPYWLAELQGGAAGHGLQAMDAVPAARQARWIWTGVARGAKGVNFWCWRDEAFGRESGGFGIVGDDGHRDDRLRSLGATAQLLRDHEALFDAYKPAQAAIGVVFEQAAYHLDWASYATTGLAPPKQTPYPAGHSLVGYLQALERLQLPYDVVETTTAGALDAYRLLVLPWPLVLEPSFGRKLADWVRAGGTLVVEASFDAFNLEGLFRYPGERTLAAELGVAASARRRIQDDRIAFDVGGVQGTLRAMRWREDLGGVAGCGFASSPVGTGRVLALGSFVGLGYWEARYAEFERFVGAAAAAASALPDVRCDVADGDVVQLRWGRSGDATLLFVTNEGAQRDLTLTIDESVLRGAATLDDFVSGTSYPVKNGRVTIVAPAEGFNILRFGT